MAESRMDGLVTTYRDDGSLIAQTTYLNGIRHGPYRDYWRNGRVSLEGQFVNGLEEGRWHFYDEDGSLRELIQYRHGREIVDWDEFFRSAQADEEEGAK